MSKKPAAAPVAVFDATLVPHMVMLQGGALQAREMEVRLKWVAGGAMAMDLRGVEAKAPRREEVEAGETVKPV